MKPHTQPQALPLREQLILLLPALLLVFGPPIWRGFLSRSLQASAAGQLDFNIVMQLLCYFLAATLLVYQALRWQHFRMLPRHSIPLLLIMAIAPLGLFMSVVHAPSALLTIVMAVLFSLGWFIALQLAVFIGQGRVQIQVAILSFLAVNFLLLLLVLITNVVAPKMVGVFSFGMWRVRGNDVADLALAAVFTILGALYLFIFQRRLFSALLIAAIGIYALFLPQIRVSVAAFIVALMGILAFETKVHDPHLAKTYRTRNTLIPAILVVPILGLLLAAIFSDQVSQFFTRGNLKSVTTLSGRTLAWEWIEEHSLWMIGHGYISGFRHDFQNLDVGLATQFLKSGLKVRIMGHAHSTVYELIYGLGWLYGLGLFMLMLVILILLPLKDFLLLSKQRINRWQGFSFAVGIVVSISMFTQSAFIMPPGHHFGVLMYALALSLGIHFSTRSQASGAHPTRRPV